jgi:hypothetical protein
MDSGSVGAPSVTSSARRERDPKPLATLITDNRQLTTDPYSGLNPTLSHSGAGL